MNVSYINRVDITETKLNSCILRVALRSCLPSVELRKCMAMLTKLKELRSSKFWIDLAELFWEPE